MLGAMQRIIRRDDQRIERADLRPVLIPSHRDISHYVNYRTDTTRLEAHILA